MKRIQRRTMSELMADMAAILLGSGRYSEWMGPEVSARQSGSCQGPSSTVGQTSYTFISLPLAPIINAGSLPTPQSDRRSRPSREVVKVQDLRSPQWLHVRTHRSEGAISNAIVAAISTDFEVGLSTPQHPSKTSVRCFEGSFCG